MMSMQQFLVTLLLSSVGLCEACEPLNHFIPCHETLSQFQLSSRPLSSDSRSYQIHFHAFFRDFSLELSQKPPDEQIIRPNVRIHIISSGGKEQHNLNITQVFGSVLHETSTVQGIVIDFKFYGVIHLSNDSYYVDNKARYIQSADQDLIIYRASDLQYWSQLQNSSSQKAKPRRGKQGPMRQHTGLYEQSYRPKKAFSSSDVESDSLICHMHLVADHTYFTHQGLGSVDETIGQMIYHIEEANFIYRTTDFDGDGKGDNIWFLYDEITIYNDISDPTYTFTNVGLEVETVLDRFSTYDFDGYCLAALFTHRDYSGGVIGLAWTASSSIYGSIGGLCQERVYYYDPPFYDQGYYNFNTMLISTLNYGEVLDKKVSALTLTHELGHAFGSPHDSHSNPDCSPGGLYGNYLMYPTASDADKPNNFKFSSCSQSHIYPVLVSKGGCLELISAGTPVCGNRIVEAGEDCDCGVEELCAINEPCCGSGCRYATEKNHTCSPLTSLCCSSQCEVTSSELNIVCLEESECSTAAVCDGIQDECPTAQPREDGTPCSKGICFEGECTINLCLMLSLWECQCTSGQDTMCQLCCQSGNQTCVPAFTLGLTDSDGGVMYKSAGRSCNNYRGYCDEELQCVLLDSEAPWDRLKDLFSTNSLQKAYKWMQNYWYLVLILVSAVVVLAIIFRQHARCQKKDPLNTMAMQSGKMARLWMKANNELERLEKDAQLLKAKFSDIVEREHKKKPVDMVVAIGRMCFFFPTVPRKLVIQTIKYSGNEEFAVKQLLLQGYPLRKS